MNTVPLVNLVPDGYPRTKDGYLIKPGDTYYCEGETLEVIGIFRDGLVKCFNQTQGNQCFRRFEYLRKEKLSWLDEQINDYRRHYEFHKSRNNREMSRIYEGALMAMESVKNNLDKCKH